MNILCEERVGAIHLLVGTAPGSLADLHPRERARLSPRANDKRAADFIAGRLMAKEALRRACGHGDWIIDRDSGEHEGAPIVVGPVPAHVSISHVDGFVAAAASAYDVAVDLVKLEALPEALCEEAFTAREREAWGDGEAMAVAFAAKECALKWLKIGMGIALHEVQVMPLDDCTLSLHAPSTALTLTYRTLSFSSTSARWLSLALFQRSDA